MSRSNCVSVVTPPVNCPECGADLRDVGIVSPLSPTKKRGSRLRLQVPFWTVVCFLFVWGLANMITPWVDGDEMAYRIAYPITAILWAGGLAYLWRHRNDEALTNSTGSPEHQIPATEQPATTTTAVLTIMFIDMKDFTAHAAQQSRHDLVELVQRLRDTVEPYSGEAERAARGPSKFSRWLTSNYQNFHQGLISGLIPSSSQSPSSLTSDQVR